MDDNYCVEVLVQARRVKDGEWEVLGNGDAGGHRTRWWEQHATPGAFDAFRTIRRTTITTVTVEVLDDK